MLKDIARTWVNAAGVLEEKSWKPVHENHLLGYLLMALLVSFALRFPALTRMHAELGTGEPLEAFIAANLVSTMLFGALAAYLLAALSHLTARAVGGRGSWQQARLALFWCMVAFLPFGVLIAILDIFAVPDLVDKGVRLIVILLFFNAWIRGLAVLERAP